MPGNGEAGVNEPIDRLSVVVPTYNRRERLHRVLSALAAQHVDVPVEVVVVSDGSTDGTDEFLRGDLPLPIRPVFQDNQGPSVARNAGIDHATGDLIVFIDDDVVVEAGALEAHLDAHRRLGDRMVVIGPMLDPVDIELLPWVRWEQRQLAKQYDAMNAGRFEATCRQFYTGNASVRREHLVALGGFDPEFRRAEDVELAFRMDDAGLGFHFEPAAVGRHYAERSYEAWRTAARLYGRNDIVFAREHGRAWVEEMIGEDYGRRPRPFRWVIAAAIRFPTAGSALATMTDRLVAVVARTGPERVLQAGFSMIYALEFHRGASEQLGSPTAYFEMLRARRSPDDA